MTTWYNKAMNYLYDTIIIGGGPAGLTAAVYASRANLKTLIIEAGVTGGKLSKTYEIENYPGFKQISGLDLATNLGEHALSFGAEQISGQVTKIEKNKEFMITLDNGQTYISKTIIVATGTKERTLNLPRSEEFTGRGISYCSVCDGFFYRKKPVVVIGGGNSALEESLYLSSIVAKVTIVIRRDVFRAEAKIVEKVLQNEKIEVIYNSLPDSLQIEDDKIVGLNIKNVNDGTVSLIEAAGIFPYIGADPCTDIMPKNILDENGYIIVNQDMSTSIVGLYAAGDVIKKDLRQVVTACNDGAIAANSIVKLLK